ncbi:MAG: hypothetical protein JW763_01300 [candidate division Zixibacteria bacterium]|nr:hypothetical protein [candidate division Zixibacteria bacterium]
MNTEKVVLSGGAKQIERQARGLISDTLSQLGSGISIAAIKIDCDGVTREDAFIYHCTILVKLKNGRILRSKARDDDEMLAVYKALSKTIDSLPQEHNSDRN